MRLIDADAIRMKAVPHTRGEYGYSANIRKWAVLVGDIDDAPTIAPESLRVHGEWTHARTYYEIDECNCSLCGQLMTTAIDKRMNYCPNCGAFMKGGADNA